MASVSAPIAGEPVSGRPRMPPASTMTTSTAPSRRISLAKSCSPSGSLADVVGQFGDPFGQALLGGLRVCRPGCRILRAWWRDGPVRELRVSSRRFISPSRICIASSTSDGGSMPFDLQPGHLPPLQTLTRLSAQRSNVSDQNSHSAIGMPV